MKENTKRGFLVLIVAISLLLIGAAMPGCTSSGNAQKSGLGITAESGLGMLSSGSTITQGESFNIKLKIENYDKTARTGEICVRDNMDDSFKGVASECFPFSVRAAEVIEQAKAKSGFFSFGSQEKIDPGVEEIILPASSQYSYEGLPSTQQAKLTLSAKYVQDSIISSSTGVAIPEPATETIQVEQEPAPVSVSVEKSIIKIEDSYKVQLGIQLKKQQAKVFAPDFSEENYVQFSAEMLEKLDCKPDGEYDAQKLSKGLIELRQSTKFIKCLSLLNGEERSLPLQIKLKYGVEIDKEFTFTIKVEK